MRRIDHVRKTVYIIVGCLTIISLVLTICHKVGHCASGGGSGVINSFPLPVGDSYGHDFTFDDTDVDIITNACSGFDNTFPRIDYVAFYDLEVASNNLICHCLYAPDFNSVDNIDNHQILSLSGDTLSFRSGGSYVGFLIVNYNLTSRSVNSFRWQNSQSSLDSRSWFESAAGGFTLKLNENLYTYPIWIRSDSDYFANSLPSFSGHSKGGVLVNYIDSDDLIEQDSSLPTVDTSSPADPSSNSGWFQKILNGLAKINQSIKGGILTIGDYIGQGFENVINWLTEPFDQEAFSDELDQVFLLSDILGAKDLLDQTGIFDWEDITPSQNVSWTFDFGGAVLPHTSCTIDFSWYTGTVKNIIVTLICTFLVVGLLATLFNSIPGIISGHSGDKGGGSDS